MGVSKFKIVQLDEMLCSFCYEAIKRRDISCDSYFSLPL